MRAATSRREGLTAVRLAILTQYYPPEIGAPQARLSQLAARFVEQGHEVFVLTAMPSYPLGRVYPGYGGIWRREVLGGVTIIRSFIFPTKSAGLVPRLANYFSFVMSSLLVGSLTLPKVDYLLTESPPLFLGITGYVLSRLKRARWIFNVSDLWPESAVRLGIVREGWPLRVAQRLEAFCYRKAWLVTGQSRGILDDIFGRFPGLRTFHLTNGVDTEVFGPHRRAETQRRVLGPEGSCVALYAGLHGLAQGLEQILEAADLLRNEAGLQFVLLGDGPDKEKLLAEARRRGLSNMRFLDPRRFDEMPGILASADVLLVTLKKHIPGAVPSKIYEAMGTGRPVVLAASGEAAEIVDRHQAGIVVEPGDAAALSRAVKALLDAPDLRCRLGENARRAAETHYDRRAIAARFIDHLETGLRP